MFLLSAFVAAEETALIHSVQFKELGPHDQKAQVLGDRFEYWADDRLGQFYALLEPPPAVPGKAAPLILQILLKRRETGEAVMEFRQPDPPSHKFHFLVQTSRLAAGPYQVSAGLLDAASGQAIGQSQSFEFARVAKEMPRQNVPVEGIPIRLPPQGHVPDVVWPVRASIPLPLNAVNQPDDLWVYEDDQPLPAQIQPAATWGPGGGSLQWVHAHFLARYEGGQPAAYRLGLRQRRPPPEPRPAILCEQTGEHLVVDTGVLKFQVGRKSFGGIDQAWCDTSGDRRYDEEHLVFRGPGGPFLVDGRAIRFDGLNASDLSVEFEEVGPIRAVVRATGWYDNPEHRVKPICRFIIRLLAYAGQPLVRVQHRTVIAYDTRLYRLADLGFHLAAPLGAHFSLGADGNAIEGDLPAAGQALFFHQDRHDHFRMVGNGPRPVEGGRSDGWFMLHPAGAPKKKEDDPEEEAAEESPSVLVLLRDVWQKFPKEVEFSSQGLTLHFWPRHGHRAFTFEEELDIRNIYKFWCFHQHALLDLNLPPDYFERLKTYPGTLENIPEHALNGNGQGLAISNEFLVLFGDETEIESPEGWSRLFDQDPTGLAPPGWNARTGAMGDLAGADDPRFAPTEEAIEKAFLSYTRSVERGSAYGLFNYADTHTYWNVREGSADLHRVWHNSHYHEAGKTWLLYFRSGSQDLLRWARASTDHYVNVDTINAAFPDDPAAALKFHVPGAMYHCKGQTHWGGEAYGMQRRDGHAGLWGHWVDPDAALWCWTLDANPAARDVYETWRSSIRKYGLPLTGVAREINTTLAYAVNLYRATWDADLLPAIHGMGHGLRTGMPLSEQFPGPMWHPLWINRYYELTRDPAYVPFILENGRQVGLGDTWIVALSALAYQISGDRAYLTQHFDRLLEMPRSFYRESGDPYDWYGWGPGPIGSRWFWMGWGYYLKQLQASGIEKIVRQNDPRGAFPFTGARYNTLDGPPSLAVHALEEKDGPFRIDFTASSLGGDLHAISLVVVAPSGKRIHHNPQFAPGASSKHLDEAFPADGETGLYRIEFRAHEANVYGPITNLPAEAAMAARGVAYRTSRTYAYVWPKPAAETVQITIASASDQTPCSYIVSDRDGGTVADGTLFRPRPKSAVQVLLDPARHPLPWLIDTLGLTSVQFDGEFESILWSPSKDGLAKISSVLKEK